MRRRLPGFPSAARTIGWGGIRRAASGCCATGARRPLDTCAQAGLRHIRTRPYTPRTNGKAERFIQTSLRERAYARAYLSSAERTHAMHPWIADCNHRRPHSALGGQPPALRLNNVLGFDT